MSVFLMIIKVPYWLPLALFCGIVSQFVPTLGTYIGGALPVLFAWGERGIGYAIGVVVFITVYQQIENLVLSPKISERTMDLNPCIAFLTVLFFGSIFGAAGAFLALPITASIQVLLKVAMKRYPLVDMPLMSDPEPNKKSKMVEAADAINEHVIKPVSDHMPRQAKGSSAHVSFDDDHIQYLREQMYGSDREDDAASGHAHSESEESPTMAIPKHLLERHAGEGLQHKPRRGVPGKGESQNEVDIVRKTDTAESSTPVESERTDSDGAKLPPPPQQPEPNQRTLGASGADGNTRRSRSASRHCGWCEHRLPGILHSRFPIRQAGHIPGRPDGQAVRGAHLRAKTRNRWWVTSFVTSNRRAIPASSSTSGSWPTNCDDGTAQLARDLGCHVVERFNQQQVGKAMH